MTTPHIHDDAGHRRDVHRKWGSVATGVRIVGGPRGKTWCAWRLTGPTPRHGTARNRLGKPRKKGGKTAIKPPAPGPRNPGIRAEILALALREGFPFYTFACRLARVAVREPV